MDELQLYLWMAAFLLVSVLLLLPRRGLLARWRARRTVGQRALVEDALKHLLSRERRGHHASAQSLAGALGLSGDATLRLVASMEGQGLLQSRDGELRLTSEGERWALHVLRAHRLWERFLADEARMPLENVHREAERREHGMTAEQLDQLEASLGHPEQDPHGDPIPTRAGDIPPSSGTPLTGWPPDTPGRIVHLEDEPPIAYEQILAEGLHLGQTLRVLEASPQRLLLSDGESEYRLAPAVAANVYLVPVPKPAAAQKGVIPLNELADGAQAEVVALDESCQGFTRRRLLDLGLTPGASLEAELRNFFGDPRAYRLRGTLIALRREQAAKVWVRPVAKAGDA